MTRDPVIMAILTPLEATFRRMSSHERRLQFLSRELRLPAPPVPSPGEERDPPQARFAAGDGQLRMRETTTDSL